MKRSALALGASVLAFALTTGSAAADPGQTAADSTGAAQVGAASVDAPVRVLSDGNGTTADASAGSPQTTSDSTGAAQVTSVDANAPVRVLSDGDDASTGAGAGGDQSAGDSQTTSDSAASAQAGSPRVEAPVRVLSDGDETAAGGEPTGGKQTGGEQAVGDSTGSAQLGSPAVYAPVRIASGGTTPSDDSDPGLPDPEGALAEIVGALLGDGPPATASQTPAASPEESGGAPSADDLRRLRDGSDPDPAVRFISDVPGNGSSGEARVLGVSAAGGLPYTGLGLVAIAVAGAWLLASGLALRIVPGGKRR